MIVDINDERHKTECWRCGHPKKESQFVCDHCEESLEFMLGRNVNDKRDNTGI